MSRTLTDAMTDHSIDLDDDGFTLMDTVWDDMVMDVFSKRLASTSGGVDYDYDENCIIFHSGGSISDSNDRVGGNQQILHQFKNGTVTFNPHIHWFQAGTTAFTLTMRYRFQKNGQAKTESWTTISLTIGGSGTDVFTYSSGTLVQISKFPGITLDVTLSDTIQIQLARTDSESGDMKVFFFDLHGEIDSLGSKSEYSKD